jgi:hypothetical protein
MANGNPSEARDDQQHHEKRTKKTYVKPAFRFEHVFETQALSCGKIGATSTQCKLNHKLS